MSGRAARWPAVLVGGALLVSACSRAHSGADLKPHPLPGAVTTVVDYAAVALPRVPGSTTTTAVLAQGTATIDGSVSGPAGLLPGATVSIEHLAAGKTVRTDVVTGPDGRFTVPNIAGGRYRVRAFLPPALSLATPDVRFIEDGKVTTFDLRVDDQRKVVARAAVAPSAPYVGDDVNLAVVVANQTVDTDGIVRSTPLPGLRVELSGLGAYVLKGPDQGRGPIFPRGTTTTTTFGLDQGTVAFTDGLGQVQYPLHCAQAGDPGLDLLVTVTVTPTPVPGQPPPLPESQIQHLPLSVPACIDPTTITTAPDTSTSSPRTSTTRIG